MGGMADADPKLLTTPFMARRLRVPVGWLRDEADAGRIPSVKAGRVFLFSPEAVESALLERARAGGSDG
jgi:excisionase family DNA binding protein